MRSLKLFTSQVEAYNALQLSPRITGDLRLFWLPRVLFWWKVSSSSSVLPHEFFLLLLGRQSLGAGKHHLQSSWTYSPAQDKLQEYGQDTFPCVLLSGCPASRPQAGCALCQPLGAHTKPLCDIAPPWGSQPLQGVLAVLTGLSAPLGSQAEIEVWMRSSRRIRYGASHSVQDTKWGGGEGLKQMTHKVTAEDKIWGQDQVVMTRNW